jgi:hypothetical protein
LGQGTLFWVYIYLPTTQNIAEIGFDVVSSNSSIKVPPVTTGPVLGSFLAPAYLKSSVINQNQTWRIAERPYNIMSVGGGGYLVGVWFQGVTVGCTDITVQHGYISNGSPLSQSIPNSLPKRVCVN